MKFLFLMDPPHTVNIKKDTTFAFMEGAQKRGHNAFYVPKGGIVLNQGTVQFHATAVTAQRVPEEPLILGMETVLSAEEADAVFIRPDPPFDPEYLMNTWLLDHARDQIVVINDPNGVRTVNEKVWATQFTEIIPRTVVTRHKSDYLAFLKQEGEVIIKPTDGHGGTAVFRVRQGDSNANVTFEVLSQNGQVEVIIQEYLPDATVGDKRILLLNGELLGAVLRVHSADDHRNNFFAGGHPEATTVTEKERTIIETLKPHLQRLRLYFVGIDVIGERLVEVNVTSPTGIQEASHFANKRLDDKVIAFVENLVMAKKGGIPNCV
ncbi:glutathione synthase [Chloroflexi bacterium TSY]|nr:glutathione synthase [Chloroflexi bacterium TSY]